MTAKIHTMVAVAVVRVAQDGRVKTKINNRPHMEAQELPVIF
jgi:hypothetical protein